MQVASRAHFQLAPIMACIVILFVDQFFFKFLTLEFTNPLLVIACSCRNIYLMVYCKYVAIVVRLLIEKGVSFTNSLCILLISSSRQILIMAGII